MTENPYNAPQAELPVRKPKLLRTVATGAMWGVAVGVAVSIMSTLRLKYEGEDDIYWPGMLMNDITMYILPLTLIGGCIAFAIGVVRILIRR